jgi:hypothetical protein
VGEDAVGADLRGRVGQPLGGGHRVWPRPASPSAGGGAGSAGSPPSCCCGPCPAARWTTASAAPPRDRRPRPCPRADAACDWLLERAAVQSHPPPPAADTL